MRKKSDNIVSQTGSAQSQSGGVANTGFMVVNELHQHFDSADKVNDPEIANAVSMYSKRVSECYTRLDLEVLTPLSEQGDHPAVPLREVFVRPLVRADPPPIELPRELMNRLVEMGEIASSGDLPPGVEDTQIRKLQEAYKKNPPVDALEALTESEFDRVVLLGDPGPGKSTLARFLALSLTSEQISGPLAKLAGRVPLVIELRRYAEERWRDRTFEDFLDHLYATEKMSVTPAALCEILSSGKFVALFDGLDEVFDPAVRKIVTQRIAAFSSSYPGGRFIVTSRTIGYQRATLDGANYKHYMLQDLTENKIREFAELWYANACPHDAKEAAQLVRRISEAVAYSRPIRELAGNPLLLTILAIIGRRQSLPRDRQGVYRHAVTVLIAHLDQDVKHLKHSGRGAELLDILDADDLNELLRLLARHMQEGHGGIAGNHIHAQELEVIIQEYLQQYELPLIQAKEAARAMVSRLRERNFILSRYGGEVYGFVHRAFLEYLAAADIAHRYKEDREWTPKQLIEDVIGKRARDPSWHEVVLLIVGQLNERDAAKAVDHLLDQHREAGSTNQPMLAMALRALTEVRKIGALSDQSHRLILHLTHTLGVIDKNGPFKNLSQAIPLLSAFGEFWKGRALYLHWFHSYGQFMGNPELAARIAGTLYQDARVLSVLASYSTNPHVRKVLLNSGVRNFGDLPATLELVRERAVVDSDETVRMTAVRALADGWGDAPATLELVRERAVSDSGGKVRGAAVRALADGWGDLPATLELVRERAVVDSDETVRMTAVRALADGWGDAPATLELVRERAVSDSGGKVRGAAVRALADGWGDLPATLELVRERAVVDSDETVRMTAVRALADGWGDAPATLELVRERAVTDSHETVRVAAVEALADRWAHLPATLELLSEQLPKDQSANVRAITCMTLAENWATHRPTFISLHDRAINDEEEIVRHRAIDALADHFGDTEEVYEVLLDRARNDPAMLPQLFAMLKLSGWKNVDRATAEFRELVKKGSHAIIRSLAILFLGQHVEDSPDYRKMIFEMAVEDPDASARSAALSHIATSLGTSNDLLALIHDRLDHDPNEGVRQSALDHLVGRWSNLPDTLGMVRNCAVDDVNEELRSAALNLLIREWSGRSDTQSLLQERSAHDISPLVRLKSIQLYSFLSASGPCAASIDRVLADEDTSLKAGAILCFAFSFPDDAVLRGRIADISASEVNVDVKEAAEHALVVMSQLTAVRSR